LSHLTIIKNSLALISIVFGLSFAEVVQGHPGGQDKNGCHVDSKTGKRHCHKKKEFDPTKPAHAGDEGAFYGPSVRIKDGDTLVVKIQGVEVDFRLSGIDAPEIDQPFGPEARDELKRIVGTNQCVLVPSENDKYHRYVVYLWIADLNVNEEMIRRGMAWFDSEYATDPFLYQLEIEARDEKRGLWALPQEKRVPPWEWRKEQR
jgi:endonuclease YncB( thermonuclease family)